MENLKKNEICRRHWKLIIGKSRDEKRGMLNELIIETEKAGLIINANKTKVITVSVGEEHIELKDTGI